MNADGHRLLLSNTLFDAVCSVDGVLSVTLVGSAAERDDLSTIADIDTIVICDRLTQKRFDACVERVGRITAEEIGFPGRELTVNSTFGPLKFDSANEVVIHLMIYDVAGHRRHVLKSPFTCYDWERSTIRRGPALSEIYPVLKLQPRDFMSARRGLGDYLSDLQSGVLSYRRYDFTDCIVTEVAERANLDERHRGEYAYHIIKNLVSNYAKLMTQKNLDPNDTKLSEYWRSFLPSTVGHIPFFEEIEAIKRSGGDGYPEDTIERVKSFIDLFENDFQSVWGRCARTSFVRHGRTELNDGSFLGQGRDPGLEDSGAVSAVDEVFDSVFSSPLERARQTAARLVHDGDPVIDERLSEIDYGMAEGLFYRDIVRKYPDIVEEWKQGVDVRFPGGENTANVLSRLKLFISENVCEGSNLVVTHNVVLRCLAGWLYEVPMSDWYKLVIPHLDLLNTACVDGRLYPDLSASSRAALIDGLVGFKHKGDDQ